MRPRRRSIALLAVATLLATTLVGGVVASPAPATVCSPCDRAFESTARDHGYDVRVEHSTATVRVHANGSATWTVRNRLGGTDADEFLADPVAVDRVGRDTLQFRGVSSRDPAFIEAHVSDETVVLRYRTPRFAHPTRGVLRSDALRDQPGAYLLTALGADRLTVVAPERMIVAAAPPGATVDGRRMTLRSYDPSGDGPFVVFAPQDAALGGVQAQAAILAALAPIVGRNLLWLLLFPLAVLVGAMAAVSKGVATAVGEASPERARRAGAAVVALAAVGVVVAASGVVAVGLGYFRPVLVAGGIAAAIVGSVAAWRPDQFGLREQTLALVGGLALGSLVAILIPGVMPGGISPTDAAVASVLPLLSLLGLRLGHLAARHRRRSWLKLIAVIAALAALLVVVTQPIAQQGGTLYFLLPILLAGLSLLAALLSIPLVALGAALPTEA